MKVNFKIKHFYVIEYRFWDQDTNQWITRISQEGYIDIEEARKFCRERAHNEGVTENPMYFQNITSDGVCEEYCIKEITFKDFRFLRDVIQPESLYSMRERSTDFSV